MSISKPHPVASKLLEVRHPKRRLSPIIRRLPVTEIVKQNEDNVRLCRECDR